MSVRVAAERGWIDEVIEPCDTRHKIAHYLGVLEDAKVDGGRSRQHPLVRPGERPAPGGRRPRAPRRRRAARSRCERTGCGRPSNARRSPATKATPMLAAPSAPKRRPSTAGGERAPRAPCRRAEHVTSTRSPSALCEELDEPIAPRAVDAAHPPHVAHDRPVLDELRGRPFADVVALAVDDEALAREALDDRDGGDDVSEAQARERGPWRDSRRRSRCRGRRRSPAGARDGPRSEARDRSRPRSRRTARGGPDRAARSAGRGRASRSSDTGGAASRRRRGFARATARAREGVDVEARARRPGAGTRRAPALAERGPGRRVSERLDRDGAPGAGQGPRDESERHLAPAGDEDVLGRERGRRGPPAPGPRSQRAGAGHPVGRRSRGVARAVPAVRDRRRARATRSTGTRRTSGTPPAMTSVPGRIRRRERGRRGLRQREVRSARHRLRDAATASPRVAAARGTSRRRTSRRRDARVAQPSATSSLYAATTVLRLTPSELGEDARAREERRPSAAARAARRRRRRAQCAGRPVRTRSASVKTVRARVPTGPAVLYELDLVTSPLRSSVFRGMSSYSPTPRTTLHRRPARGTYDRATVHAILDEALVCQLGFVVRRASPSSCRRCSCRTRSASSCTARPRAASCGRSPRGSTPASA